MSLFLFFILAIRYKIWIDNNDNKYEWWGGYAPFAPSNSPSWCFYRKKKKKTQRALPALMRGPCRKSFKTRRERVTQIFEWPERVCAAFFLFFVFNNVALKRDPAVQTKHRPARQQQCVAVCVRRTHSSGRARTTTTAVIASVPPRAAAPLSGVFYLFYFLSVSVSVSVPLIIFTRTRALIPKTPCGARDNDGEKTSKTREECAAAAAADPCDPHRPPRTVATAWALSHAPSRICRPRATTAAAFLSGRARPLSSRHYFVNDIHESHTHTRAHSHVQ